MSLKDSNREEPYGPGYGFTEGSGGTPWLAREPSAEWKGFAAGRGPDREDARIMAERGGPASEIRLRARWIHSPEEHEERAGESLATRRHSVIRRWAEDRGAQPATVPGTEHGIRPGVLRFNFPGYGGQAVENLTWDDWFKSFDERRLVFVFREHKSDGRVSNFFRLERQGPEPI